MLEEVQINLPGVNSVPMVLPSRPVTGGMSCCNLPGRTGEQSSPASYKSISNCPDKFSENIQHAAGNPCEHAAQTSKIILWFLSIFFKLSLSSKEKSCVLLRGNKNVSHWSTQYWRRLPSGSSLPGRGPEEPNAAGVLLPPLHFLAAEVKERTERRSQSVVRWRAVEAHFTQHCGGLAQYSA